MKRAELLNKYAEPISVLDKGYVKLVDVMGDDNAIVEAARTSYVQDALLETGERTEEQNRNLIRYIFRNYHTSPFEMVEIKLQVRVPMDCWRQWIRHRMASVNEYSTRYSSAIDAMQETSPEAWRLQSKSNKQGSQGFLPSDLGVGLSSREKELHEHARDVYEDRIGLGVAREQARKDLPLSNYTVAVWKIDGNNLFKFLGLRMDPHAQLEIREYAWAIFDIVKDWLPIASQAFLDYRFNAARLSAMELAAMRYLLEFLQIPKEREYLKERLTNPSSEIDTIAPIVMGSREWNEFFNKLGIPETDSTSS